MQTIKPRVLIVEDEPALLETLKEYLLFEYNVTTAQTARQAFNAMKDGIFKAAIVDLNLPDTNGLEVIKAIRNKFTKTTIVVLTGDQQSETIKKAIEMGADDYLVKPVDKAMLLKRLQKCILKHSIQS